MRWLIFISTADLHTLLLYQREKDGENIGIIVGNMQKNGLEINSVCIIITHLTLVEALAQC